jgi:hypothetical protein
VTNNLLSKQEISRIKSTPITSVQPGDSVYVDLRWYGSEWYSSLSLPNLHFSTYVILMKYGEWVVGRASNHLKIKAYVPVFQDEWIMDPYSVFAWGSSKTLLPSMQVVDSQFLVLYPQLSITK